MSDQAFYFAIGMLLAAFGNLFHLDFIVDAFAAAGAFLILGVGALYIYYQLKVKQDE